MKNLKYIHSYGSIFTTYLKYDKYFYSITIPQDNLKVFVKKLKLNGLPEDFINQMISDKVDFEYNFHVKEHKILFEIDIYNLKAKIFENFHLLIRN